MSGSQEAHSTALYFQIFKGDSTSQQPDPHPCVTVAPCAGAQQFAVDCAGVVAVFAAYTKRPAAHFKCVFLSEGMAHIAPPDA